MNKIKLKNNKFNIYNSLLLIFIIIIFISLLLINTIGKKVNNNIIYTSNTLINTINTNMVNSNIKIDLLNKYNMNDLIKINYNNNNVSNIDYNLDNAYKLLIDLKQSIINNVNKNEDLYNYKYEVYNNKIIVEMPFYNYTNNILISNLGPKIIVQLSLIKLIDGSVKTKIKDYGINSLLVELYLNFTINSSIVVPSMHEQEIINNYEILISSKVIQGEIPNFYNGLYENSSKIINT